MSHATLSRPIPVSAVCLINDTNEILLTTRTSLPLKGYLEFPGGKQEPNEQAKQTAQRELFEETGIKTTTQNLHLIYQNIHNHIFLSLFACHTWQGHFIAKEGQEAFWFPLTRVMSLLDHPSKTELILDGHPILPQNRPALQAVLQYHHSL